MEIPKETQEKIQKVQVLEQNLQSSRAQKQQLQSQLLEAESALEELKETSQSYKIIGNIMVATDKEELKKDLDSKKEVFELRLKKIEDQEEKIRENVGSLQKEIVKEMETK
jgi:prefoldin beta subunit